MNNERPAMDPSPALMTTEDNLPDLERVQRWMLAVITHPDGIDEGADAREARRWIDGGAGRLESVVTRSRTLSASERLAVYGNAYYARLLECLGEVYPVLKRTLGDDTFEGFAFAYLQQHPSSSCTLHELGRLFPAYLEETRPAAGEQDAADWADFLVDLARLECAISPLELPSFTGKPDDRWLRLRFRTAPCLRLMEFRYPVNNHYTAVRATDDELHLDFPGPGRHFLALSRRDYVVRRYSLNEAQHVLLGALGEGDTMEEALTRLLDSAALTDPDDLQSKLPAWFRHWSAERCFFTGIEGT